MAGSVNGWLAGASGVAKNRKNMQQQMDRQHNSSGSGSGSNNNNNNNKKQHTTLKTENTSYFRLSSF